MARDDVLFAFAWHQRTSSLDSRERLLSALTSTPDRAVLATCHRVEAYVASPAYRRPDVPVAEVDPATVHEGVDALAHLIAVAAGLDSAIAGEPQILSQVRRAYAASRPVHPLLARSFEHALHAGRAIRHEFGLASARSVGSLAVDRLVERLLRPNASRVLVVGAGEMGKLAVRALAQRVSGVVIANRDLARAQELAASHGATAIPLAEIASALPDVDAVVSAADTRGALFDPELLRARVARGPFVVIDIAVPRSIGPEGRAVLGASYLSVDDLATDTAVGADTLALARARCREEAERAMSARAPERVDAIRALRSEGERLRALKVGQAMRKLGHLPERDRRVVERLSTSITNALLHRPTVELRDR